MNKGSLDTKKKGLIGLGALVVLAGSNNTGIRSALQGN